MTGSRRPSALFIVLCLVFGIAVGYVVAAVFLSLVGVAVGESVHRGAFILVWIIASLVFFAWPLQVVQRAYDVKRQREIMKERVGDLDFEPSLPGHVKIDKSNSRDEIVVKAREIDQPRWRRLLARGRTAEQRMADYLASRELQAEAERAKRPGDDTSAG